MARSKKTVTVNTSSDTVMAALAFVILGTILVSERSMSIVKLALIVFGAALLTLGVLELINSIAGKQSYIIAICEIIVGVLLIILAAVAQQYAILILGIALILYAIFYFVINLKAFSRGSATVRKVIVALMIVFSLVAGILLIVAYAASVGSEIFIAAGVFVLAAQEIGFAPLANYNLYTMKGMFIVYLYFQIPMGTLLLIPTFEKVRKEWKEAARLMNAGSAQFWLKIGIPVMMPGILGTFNMLFSNAVAAYATPYLLVNNNIPLLPIKVVDMFVGDVRQRPELGSALSITLLAIVLIEIGLTNLCKKHFEKGTRS